MQNVLQSICLEIQSNIVIAGKSLLRGERWGSRKSGESKMLWMVLGIHGVVIQEEANSGDMCIMKCIHFEQKMSFFLMGIIMQSID